MRPTWGLLVTVSFLALAACGEPAPAPEDDPGSEAALRLPDEFQGTWEHTGTSGGLDGEGVPMPEGPPARFTLTRESTWEVRGSDGEIRSRSFTVKKGKTIFSAEPQWMIAFASGEPVLVLVLGPDGTLVTSENVYDGYSSSHRRVE